MHKIADTTSAEPATPIGQQQRKGTGIAHAKAILFGEHAVVYGASAIAVPLHQLDVQADVTAINGYESRIDSELFAGTLASAPESLRPVITAIKAGLPRSAATGPVQLRLRSAIPQGRGLGSSAAVAAAIARATADFLGQELTADELFARVQLSEQVAHGTPSGIDARAVAADKPIRFEGGRVTGVEVGAPLTFVLADSGIPGSTAEAVGSVRELRAQNPSRIDRVIAQLTELTEGSTVDIGLGNLPTLGERMNAAHILLGELGVSTPRMDTLVAAANTAGAFGAKLTGGGLGGCVLALASDEDHAEHIALTLRASGAPRTWTTTVQAS